MAVRGRAVETLPKLMRSLRKDSASSTVTRTPALPSLRRAFSLYDQINLIDNVPDDQLRFQRFFLFSPSLIYTETGFTVNGVNYEGSLLCVGNLVTSWGPRKFSEITPQSILLVFSIPVSPPVVPGEPKEAENNFLMQYIEPVDPELRRFIRSTGMKLEALDSRNAASTYNILNEEDERLSNVCAYLDTAMGKISSYRSMIDFDVSFYFVLGFFSVFHPNFREGRDREPLHNEL
ncbi:hypothetical protein CXB51_003536 [Gossypium anomalum]|uniref:Uncharacterized protein n=1 Tax=Gossypium anomalum TaxID=47600 RepID=A0A8J6DBN8_9ROSI|nr:hypothetical protein CXB51_003536 [Gossypium anomalum]